MIFPERQPYAAADHAGERAEWLDRYLEGRKRYKRDLLDAMAAAVTTGPVLEFNDGFGAFGLELLERTGAEVHAVFDDPAARRLYEAKLRERGWEGRCTLIDRAGGEWPPAPGTYEMVFSVNCLHEWNDPAAVLSTLYRLTRDGGRVVINDLRRDADPFITEYVVREMAGEESEEGEFDLRVFLRSLQCAWSAEEVRRIVAGAGLGDADLDVDDAMTMTLSIRKRGEP